MSPTKRVAFSRVLAAVCVSTSIRGCVREGSKNEDRQQEMGVHVAVYSGSYARREQPPIRSAAGGLSLGKKKNPRFLALRAQIVALRRPSTVCFVLLLPGSHVDELVPLIDLHLKFSPRLFPPELRGLLRRQRGQRCVCLSRSDCSPGLQGKLKSADTH